MEQFIGTGVALVTPFKENKIDVNQLQKLVEHCIANDIDYLVAMGTTAEVATLSSEDKELAIETIVKTNAGRLPLVLGIGGNNTAVLVEELQSRDLQDFEAILSVSPYYNKPTQEGIYQHYRALAKASPIPIIMYNVPSRTGSNMEPATTLRLANDVPNIIGIKEACGDMLQITKIIQQKPDGFMVISGDDFTALPTVLAGGSGVISVLGQALPKEFSQMMQRGLQGKSTEAYELHHTLLMGMQLIFEEGNPAGIKAMLSALRIGSLEVRLPLVEASLALRQRIASYLKSFSYLETQTVKS